MSPSVNTLDFALNHDSLEVHSAFSRAFDRAPTIKTLRLLLVPWEGMVTHCHRVRRVSIVPQVDARRLPILARIPDLRFLYIFLSDTFALTDDLTLPVLDTLEAKGDWLCLKNLLNATHTPNLRVLPLEA